MKDQASALEYYHIVQELQELVDSSINKLYADDGYILLQLFGPAGRTNLVIDIPHVVYRTDNKPAFDPPGGFARFLRKRLTNTRITAIEQVRFDRILRMDIQAKEQKYRIYIELFGKGNFILCDQEDTIISLLDSIVYSDRALRGGEHYEPPSDQPLTQDMSEPEFLVHFGERACVKVLAADLGLGGEYAELVCERAGIDKDAVDVDASKLYPQVQRLFTQSEPQYTDSAAYPIRVLDDANAAKTFSEAIAAIRDGLRRQAKAERQAEKVEKVKSKVQRRLETQKHQITGYTKSAAENQRKAELLYERYAEVAQLHHEVSQDAKNMTDEQLQQKYKDHPLVGDVDRQTLTVELEDTTNP